MKSLRPLSVLFALAALLLCGCATSSPLRVAIQKGDSATVEKLLGAGAAVNHADMAGWTPLGYAAQAGQVDIVKLLLARGANPTNRALLHDGNTPLHLAAKNGNDEIVQLFLDRGMKADTANRLGQTPLMLAAWGRQPETVALLLKAGADPKLADTYGWTALHGTWRASRDDMFYRRVMKMLIEHNAPVNAQTRVPKGYTPLMSASLVGDQEVVQMLLDAGARKDVYDEDGESAYLIATRLHHDQIRNLLANDDTQLHPEPVPKTGP